jgi:hypothetical protein
MKKLRSKYHQVSKLYRILILIVFQMIFLFSCTEDTLDIQQDFPFEVKVMPYPQEIAMGETLEFRMSIISAGNYQNNQYFIRYFQHQGEGFLRYFDHKPYRPNDSYSLPEKNFRLYFKSQSDTDQSFNVWISDSFGNEKMVSFELNNKKIGE